MRYACYPSGPVVISEVLPCEEIWFFSAQFLLSASRWSHSNRLRSPSTATPGGAHVQFLADDKLEGRETGSEGLRNAEAYVVDQLTKAGLQPAGVNGFYQPVKFVSREIVEKDSSAALVSNGNAAPFVLGEDAYFNTRVDLATEEITAPLVFVGYGLKIPENELRRSRRASI